MRSSRGHPLAAGGEVEGIEGDGDDGGGGEPGVGGVPNGQIEGEGEDEQDVAAEDGGHHGQDAEANEREDQSCREDSGDDCAGGEAAAGGGEADGEEKFEQRENGKCEAAVLSDAECGDEDEEVEEGREDRVAEGVPEKDA